MTDSSIVSLSQASAQAFRHLLRISSCELKQSISSERILKEMKERANKNSENFAPDEGPTRITTAVYSAMDMLGQVHVEKNELMTKYFIVHKLIVLLD